MDLDAYARSSPITALTPEQVALLDGVGATPTELCRAAQDVLTGAEAWAAYRDGADPMTFGVHGTENWGAAEIVGNAIRDLAAVNKVETMPWDEWGPMSGCYEHGVTAEIESLMDEIGTALVAGEAELTAVLYRGLQVPSELDGST